VIYFEIVNIANKPFVFIYISVAVFSGCLSVTAEFDYDLEELK